jgi:hypothetical protein
VTFAQRTIECSNCGDSFPWGLLIAALALCVAAGALYVSAREHREFMKQVRARARFDLKLTIIDVPNNLPDEPIEVDGDTLDAHLQLHVENYGERRAGETLINVRVPRTLPDFLPATAAGTIRTQGRVPIADPDPIKDADGHLIPAKWAHETAESIPRKTGGVLTYYRFRMPVPSEGEAVCRIEATAAAEELPDDVAECTGELVVRVRHKPAA